MRGLLLFAALVVGGCQGFGAPGAPPPPDALTIGFVPTDSLPTQSTDPGLAYSTGVAVSCTVGGYLAFHANVSADANASSAELAIAKVDANGNETAAGSPVPFTVVASEPPPTDLNSFIYEPISVPRLSATLGAGDYHARIVTPDGTVLAFGRFSITP